MIRRSWICLLIPGLLACEGDDSRFSNDIIVVSVLAPDQQVWTYVGYLNVKAERPYNSPPYRPIENGIVVISDSVAADTLSYSNSGDDTGFGEYRDHDHSFQIRPNYSYDLQVTVGEKLITARTRVPAVPDLSVNSDTVLAIYLGDTIHPITGLVFSKYRVPVSAANSKSVLLRQFQFVENESPFVTNFYSLTDTLGMCLYADSSAAVQSTGIGVSYLDSAFSMNGYTDWLVDTRFVVALGLAGDFLNRMESLDLDEKTNVHGGLGFFGSASYNFRSIVVLFR